MLAVAVLLTGFGSVLCALTEAVLATVPTPRAVATIVTTARSLDCKSPSAQVTELPLFVHAPRVVCTDTNRRLAANVSDRTTLVATLGPRFVTEMEYVSG